MHLSLQDIDCAGSAIIDFFGHWCTETCGGPYEFFVAMDRHATDQVMELEFLSRLHRLGFFSAPDVPKRVASAKLVQRNLFPILDPKQHGFVTAKDMLFLEKDLDKRQRIKRELELRSRFGQQAAARKQPLRSAEELLMAHRNWSPDEWMAAYWDGEHGSRPTSPVAGAGPRRPSSAINSSRRPLSASSSASRKLFRPSSAPSLGRRR
jgi:hypothetical protein